jgi:putative aminopeptidase FrvX
MMAGARSLPRTLQRHHMTLLRALTEAVGVSGDEGEIRRLVREQVEPLADEVRVDALGNLLAIRRGSSRRRLRVMLAAHMDEVGLMITGAEPDGSLHVGCVGGILPQHLAGKAFWIGKERVPGVIGLTPPHLTDEKGARDRLEVDRLRLDIGASSREEALERVRIGDRASFATALTRMDDCVSAKALDDRLGVAILIELLGAAPANIDVLAAFTVQEEMGRRGAGVAAHSLDPELAIAIDCTLARDLPRWDGAENTAYNARLGQGPAIYIADRETVSDRRLIDHFESAARAARLPYQFRQPGGGGTDAGAIHRARKGIPAISVSVPVRYPHSAAGLIRIDDWRNTVLLLQAALIRLSPETMAQGRRA